MEYVSHGTNLLRIEFKLVLFLRMNSRFFVYHPSQDCEHLLYVFGGWIGTRHLAKWQMAYFASTYIMWIKMCDKFIQEIWTRIPADSRSTSYTKRVTNSSIFLEDIQNRPTLGERCHYSK